MQTLIKDVIKTAQQRSVMPQFPDSVRFPLPAINDVELYLTFHGNDTCAHCITNSGPHRKEIMTPNNAKKVIGNIAKFSVLTRLHRVERDGTFVFKRPQKWRVLDSREEPPDKLTDRLRQDYTDCLMGKGYTSQWNSKSGVTELNFGRPSIRISGGEFYTWPHELNGRKLDEGERLYYQRNLLDYIREALPEYDIFILTNGRFAESYSKTIRVIDHWSGKETAFGGLTRVCISVDIFHKPPRNSTVEEMLQRAWDACKLFGMGAPFLYGNASYRIGIMGRALDVYSCCKMASPERLNVSGSTINLPEKIEFDPIDLVTTGGCNELKGFICETEYGTILVNNIVVLPTGRLAYCCACIGDFGDFIEQPMQCLDNILKDPVAMMLRREQTAINLLNIAVELDPTIKVFGRGKFAAVTGSTCYQMLSGKRVAKCSRVPEAANER